MVLLYPFPFPYAFLDKENLRFEKQIYFTSLIASENFFSREFQLFIRYLYNMIIYGIKLLDKEIEDGKKLEGRTIGVPSHPELHKPS